MDSKHIDLLNHDNQVQDAEKNQQQEIKTKSIMKLVSYDSQALANSQQQAQSQLNKNNQRTKNIRIINQFPSKELVNTDENQIQQLQTEEESPKKIMTQQCYYCEICQDSDFIFLPCSHEFHAECLKFILETQVNQQQSRLQCICTIKISQNIIKQYLNPFHLIIYYQIQIQMLPKNNPEPYKSKDKLVQHKWKKCTNFGCDYIYIEVLPNDGLFQCPNCIENILGKTMIFSN